MRRLAAVAFSLLVLLSATGAVAGSDDDAGAGRDAGNARQDAIAVQPGTHGGTLDPYRNDSLDVYSFTASAGERVSVLLSDNVWGDVEGPVGGGGVFLDPGLAGSFLATRTGTYLLWIYMTGPESARLTEPTPYTFRLEIGPSGFSDIREGTGHGDRHALEIAFADGEEGILRFGIEGKLTCGQDVVAATAEYELFTRTGERVAGTSGLYAGRSCPRPDDAVHVRVGDLEHAADLDIREDASFEDGVGIVEWTVRLDGWERGRLRLTGYATNVSELAYGLVGNGSVRHATGSWPGGVIGWTGGETSPDVSYPLGHIEGEDTLRVRLDRDFIGFWDASGGNTAEAFTPGPDRAHAFAPDGTDHGGRHFLVSPEHGEWEFLIEARPIMLHEAEPFPYLHGATVPRLGVFSSVGPHNQ